MLVRTHSMLIPPKRKKHRVAVEQEEAPIEEPEQEASVEEPRHTIDVARLQSRIAKLLKFNTFEPEHHYWLDTGSPELNATLGSRDKGLPYGKIWEIYGPNHGGKTAMCQILAGLAQADGASFGYLDLENSRDQRWSEKLGVDWGNTYSIYPKLVNSAKKKDTIPRLQSAEELFLEAEAAMQILAEQGVKKQFWLIDSVANIQTFKSVEAGTDGQNMNTRLSRASFLSDTLPRWAGLAANYNAMVMLINQVRMKPGVMFGDPETTPGGNALLHNCAVRARVRRVSNGLLRLNGKVIGIVGVIRNIKNKAGEASVQGEEVGFSVKWNRKRAKIEFMSRSEAESILKGERES